MRQYPTVALQVALIVFLTARIAVNGQLRIIWQWSLFAIHAMQFPASMWQVDGPATLLLSLSYASKLLLGLAPTAVLFVYAPKWRILACLFAAVTLAASVAFVRACPSVFHWVALCLLSGLGCRLVRYRFMRWTVILPMIVLVAIPAAQHEGRDGADLAARCAANDGERPTNLEADQLVARYYGLHYFPPDWLLLTGETPNDGRFMGLSHGGRGSWWLRKGENGQLSIVGASEATGNIWTSCTLDGVRWFIRAGMFMMVKPPGADGRETIQRFPFPMDGFDAPDTACDVRTGSVYASDVLDGRMVEISPRTHGQPRQREDSVSIRGGLMSMRERDGRLVMLDFQDIVVYAPADARVLHKTPAAIASSALTLCQSDGAVAVPDLAGRLRVFRLNADGGYEFDWGLSLFAPRFAEFSPDRAFIFRPRAIRLASEVGLILPVVVRT